MTTVDRAELEVIDELAGRVAPIIGQAEAARLCTLLVHWIIRRFLAAWEATT